MKHIFTKLAITLLFLGANFTIAQKLPFTERLEFALHIAPEFNSLLIKDKSPNQSVKSNIGFSAGAELNFALKEKYVFSIGFGCGFKQFTYANNNVVLNNYYNPDLGYINPTVTSTYDVAFQEIHVPVLFHYRFSKPFFIGGGIEFVKPFYAPSFHTISGNPDVAYKRNSASIDLSSNFAVSISLGYSFKLAETFQILLEPTFKIYTKGYQFGTDEMGTNDNHFYSVGLKSTFLINGKK